MICRWIWGEYSAAKTVGAVWFHTKNLILVVYNDRTDNGSISLQWELPVVRTTNKSSTEISNPLVIAQKMAQDIVTVLSGEVESASDGSSGYNQTSSYGDYTASRSGGPSLRSSEGPSLRSDGQSLPSEGKSIRSDSSSYVSRKYGAERPNPASFFDIKPAKDHPSSLIRPPSVRKGSEEIGSIGSIGSDSVPRITRTVSAAIHEEDENRKDDDYSHYSSVKPDPVKGPRDRRENRKPSTPDSA